MTKKVPGILFVGSVVIDEMLTLEGSMPMREGKYSADQDIILQDGRSVKASQVEKTYRDGAKDGITTILGGSGANCALAAAFLSKQKNIPVKIAVATKLGNGAASQAARAILEEQGITVLDACEGADFDIPRNFVISSDDRCIIVNSKDYPAVNAGFEGELQAFVRDHIDITAAHTRLQDLALMGAKISRRARKIVCADASEYSETLDNVLHYTSHALLPDELIVPGMLPTDPYDGRKVISYIQGFPNVDHAVVMCGGQPAIYKNKAQKAWVIPAKTGIGFSVEDKLAAGDNTRAGVVLSIAESIGKGYTPNILLAVESGMADGTFSVAFKGREWQDNFNKQAFAWITGRPLKCENFSVPDSLKHMLDTPN